MSRTKKVLLPKNLLSYEVYEQDTSINSDYFNVLGLPQVLTGGRNSFYLDGSEYLKNGSSILIEILDVNGNPVYHNPKVDYLEGTAILVSIEVYDTTPVGKGTIILMGEIDSTIDGFGIPEDWQNTYNVRWQRDIMIDSRLANKSQIRFLNEPVLIAKEKQFYTIASSSFVTQSILFSASLSPIYESSEQIGYLIVAQAPTTFSADLWGGVITGSVEISSSFANSLETASINIYVDDVLNETTSFATNATIKTNKNRSIESINLYSGSYTSPVLTTMGLDALSSSVMWMYNKLVVSGTNIPISFADLRLTNISTVSGEIYKTRIYARPSTTTGEYKLVSDTIPIVSELLVTESIIGYVPIGDFYKYPSASTAWYSDVLTTNLDINNITYPISGTMKYYSSSLASDTFGIYTDTTVLLNSIFSSVEVVSTNQQFTGSVSQSGYFIGTKQPIELSPTTEYTLQLDAYYKIFSGSVTLTGNTPKVDIYIVGENGTLLVDDDPLGQKVGELAMPTNAPQKRFQNVEFNFTPQIIKQGPVGLRFVVSNGFWNFSNISILPAFDKLFSPDEAKFLIPNTDFYNQYLEYKIEFFDINNNSTTITAVSPSAYFTGSSIDLGTIL